jgi:hypothetical protein
MFEKLVEEEKSAIKWIAAEYSYLTELRDDINRIDKDEKTKEESRDLRKAKKALKYANRSEAKGEEFIDYLKSAIKKHPELLKLEKGLEVSNSKLIRAFSFYVGDFNDQLDWVVRTLRKKRALEKIGQKDDVQQAEINLKRVAQDCVKKLDTLIEWTAALQEVLVNLKGRTRELSREPLLKERKENRVIIVGVGLGEKNQNAIIRALEGEGIATEKLKGKWAYGTAILASYWPRDAYTFFQGRYVKPKIGLEIEGGAVLPGIDYVIVSEGVFPKHHGLPKGCERWNTQEKWRWLQGQAKKVFGARVHVVQSNGPEHSAKTGHIDFYTLLLPNKRMLIVDIYYGQGHVNHKSYRDAALKEGLKFIEFDGRKQGRYPLNALTLSIDGKDIVVYDSKATRLRELLEKYNIKGIPVDIYEEVNQLGKIRCCTNYKTSDKNTVDLLYN